MDKVFGGLPYALAIMLTTSFTKGFCTFTDRVFISPCVPTDNFDLPIKNWFTIGTDRTDGQGFWGLPYALAIMLTTSFTKGFCTFTDRVFIPPSVPTDNFDLPMENWFTIGTDRTDGQGFWGLPYALAIMLTTSFTKGFCTFTDRVFISPSVPTDNDGRNNITKLTVGMLASVLDNPHVQPSCCLDVVVYMLNCVFWRHILLEIEFKSRVDMDSDSNRYTVQRCP